MSTQAKFWRASVRDVAAAVLLVVASCATYENTLPDGASAGSGGAGGEGAAGDNPSSGGTPAASGSTSDSAPGGKQNGGSPGVAGVSGSGEPGDAGAAGTEGGAPSDGGQPPAGGMAGMAGMAGKGGTGGLGGTGGMAGAAGTAGTGGGSPVLLSQGKPALSDSEETGKNNVASHANDGDTSTRWCAADAAVNHYWRVDLGQSRTLTKVHLLWEKDFAYLFKIETSTDGSQWSMAVDKTTSSSAVASQDHTLPANTKGRYVRVTVTGGLQVSTWASLYEAQIFGY